MDTGRWTKHRPLTAVSFITGWGFFIIGFLLTFFADGLVQPVTREFLTTVPPWMFGVLMMVAGFLQAMPGKAYRFWRAVGMAYVCSMWIGIAVWPFFHDTPANPSPIGALLWAMLATIVLDDSFSSTYSKKYDPSHHDR